MWLSKIDVFTRSNGLFLAERLLMDYLVEGVRLIAFTARDSSDEPAPAAGDGSISRRRRDCGSIVKGIYPWHFGRH